MTSSHAHLPANAPATPPSTPSRLKGTLTVGGSFRPIEVEQLDDAWFRGALTLWARVGEVAWLRLALKTGDVEYPCRVVRCQRRPRRARAVQPQTLRTLKPFSEPYCAVSTQGG